MFISARQSIQKLRPWLIAAAAILSLTSILEAGHVHGVFTQVDDQCTLCQHYVSLDKLLNSPATLLIPILLALVTISAFECFAPRILNSLTLIRAPPVLLHPR
jgi:hypothetical protein